MFTSLAFFLTIVHLYADVYGIYANKIEKKSLFSRTHPMIGERGTNTSALKTLLIYIEGTPYYI
jgi:hypothetical protein